MRYYLTHCIIIIIIIFDILYYSAAIAQLGERQTEDLKVPGSIPGGGSILLFELSVCLSVCLSVQRG